MFQHLTNHWTLHEFYSSGWTLTLAIVHFGLLDCTAINVNANDLWVLRNMVAHNTNSNPSSTWIGWFNSNDTNPCDWQYVSCNNNSQVTGLNITYSDQDSNTTINTTYWPSLIQNVAFYSSKFFGSLILDHLPQTIETLNIEGCCLDINLTQFADISHLHNLHTLILNSKGDHYGIATDFGEKLPDNLKIISIDNFIMDKFPNFANFSQLGEIQMWNCDIMKHDSFVSTTLPPQLQTIRLFFWYSSNTGLSGQLDFRPMMQQSPNLTLIELYTYGDIAFDSVDFRGINDDTAVGLPMKVQCSINSVYGKKMNDTGISFACLSSRTEYICNGERDCLSTCQCFEIPQDWQPALNDYYTYVKLHL